MSQDIFQSRYRIFQLIIILVATALVSKSFQIQIWDDKYQKQQSFKQSLTLYPSRGLMYDRNDSILTYNLAIYDLQATYTTVKESKIDTAKFCQILGITQQQFISLMEKNWNDIKFSKRKPFDFITKIPADSFSMIEEHLFEFPGFESTRRNVRGYPVDNAAHILGYISEVTARQMEKYKGSYQRGDYIGTSGLELYYEELLRGKRGVKHVLKDKWGKIQSRYKNGKLDEEAESGKELKISIDLELQKYAEQLMQNKIGAIVAIEPSTGEILLMVSAPTYNPQILSVDNNRAIAFKKLTEDSTQPLFNRALMAQYPPGSIFKPILAAIGLEEGTLTPDFSMHCPGAYILGNLSIGCHGHGATQDVAAAIQYSCNNYFCQTYRDVVNLYGYEAPEKGMGRLIDHLKSFGLGRKLGVDIPGEMSGNIPSIEYFNKRYGKGRWRFSNSVSVGIGQGELQITPLQMANLTAIIANRGFYYTPHFAKEINSSRQLIPQKFKERNYTMVHPQYFEPIVDGMERVVIAGTGRSALIPDITVCGKTGTVENPHGIDHSTFIAFAPKENPQIAIAVYVENSGWGSSYAAPIASLIIEKYIKKEIQSEHRKSLEKAMMSANLMQKNLPKKEKSENEYD